VTTVRGFRQEQTKGLSAFCRVAYESCTVRGERRRLNKVTDLQKALTSSTYRTRCDDLPTVCTSHAGLGNFFS
jgi:hypothetical protein